MAKGQEFKVVLDVELGADVLERVEKAIQRAVLMELADAHVAHAYTVDLAYFGRGIGGTGGGMRVASAEA